MTLSRNGFTLAELLLTLGVLSILLALGIPAFSKLVHASRLTTALHALTTSLATARVAAVSRRSPVSVCPSGDGRQCRRDLAWDDGWIVFVDRQRTGRPASPADVIEYSAPDLRDLAIRSTVGRHYVRYQPSGFSSGANATLRLCARGARTWVARVVVNNAGRVRSERLPAANPCPFTP